MTASKQKGTSGETELLRILADVGLPFVRTPASSPYDLTNARPGRYELEPIEALATRPDRGQWLVTVDLEDFVWLLKNSGETSTCETHIEVKRYAKFAHHSIFQQKFGR